MTDTHMAAFQADPLKSLSVWSERLPEIVAEALLVVWKTYLNSLTGTRHVVTAASVAGEKLEDEEANPQLSISTEADPRRVTPESAAGIVTAAVDRSAAARRAEIATLVDTLLKRLDAATPQNSLETHLSTFARSFLKRQGKTFLNRLADDLGNMEKGLSLCIIAQELHHKRPQDGLFELLQQLFRGWDVAALIEPDDLAALVREAHAAAQEPGNDHERSGARSPLAPHPSTLRPSNIVLDDAQRAANGRRLFFVTPQPV